MNTKPTVDIIVINWNSGLLTLAAIKPYINCTSSQIECNVHIVDNNSTDHSKSLFVDNDIPNVIYNEQNLGFGKACNLVLEKSNADYILLLNPDTTSSLLVLEKLVNFLEQNTQYGIAGPQQLNGNNEILKTCARFPDFFVELYETTGLSKISPVIFKPKIMYDWDHKEDREVDHVMGSYMLIRKSVLDTIGNMDPDYFVYNEDLDLSKRAHNAGYKSFYIAELKIYHQEGKSGDRVRKYRLYYWISSKRIYWKKHFNLLTYYTLTFLSVFVEPLTRMTDALIKKNPSDIKTILGAHWLYLKSIFKNNSQ